MNRQDLLAPYVYRVIEFYRSYILTIIIIILSASSISIRMSIRSDGKKNIVRVKSLHMVTHGYRRLRMVTPVLNHCIWFGWLNMVTIWLLPC